MKPPSKTAPTALSPRQNTGLFSVAVKEQRVTLGLLRRLFGQHGPRPAQNSTSEQKRTVMVVTALSGGYRTLRALSNLDGWHLFVARSLNAAIALRRREKIDVILYDRDLPGNDWHKGVAVLPRNIPPTCLILLSIAIQGELIPSLLMFDAVAGASEAAFRTSRAQRMSPWAPAPRRLTS